MFKTVSNAFKTRHVLNMRILRKPLLFFKEGLLDHYYVEETLSVWQNRIEFSRRQTFCIPRYRVRRFWPILHLKQLMSTTNATL